MGLFKTLVILIAVCVSIAVAKQVVMNERLTPLEELISKELQKFSSLQEQLDKAKANLNVSLVFSRSKLDDDEDLVQRNVVEFHPLTLKNDPNGLQVEKSIDKALVDVVFKFAHELDATGALSQEKFDKNGSMNSKDIYLEDIHIHYGDSDSSITLECREGESEHEDHSFEDFLSVLKDYELPVEVTKRLYDEEGKLLEDESTQYKPRKVKILESSDNMSADMQLKVAESLKRAFIMKKSGKDRMTLICRYLGIQFNEYTWHAIIGEGDHYFDYSVKIKLSLDDDIYIIYGVE